MASCFLLPLVQTILRFNDHCLKRPMLECHQSKENSNWSRISAATSTQNWGSGFRPATNAQKWGSCDYGQFCSIAKHPMISMIFTIWSKHILKTPSEKREEKERTWDHTRGTVANKIILQPMIRVVGIAFHIYSKKITKIAPQHCGSIPF